MVGVRISLNPISQQTQSDMVDCMKLQEMNQDKTGSLDCRLPLVSDITACVPEVQQLNACQAACSLIF